jgi:hypothetical protein
MAIVRNALNEYETTDSKHPPLTQRSAEDVDLAWKDYRVYVLDGHEWFDPHTSSKYSESGVSRHTMRGPSVIVVYGYAGGMRTEESHVNDPRVWAWVRRSIAEGYLSSDSLSLGINNLDWDENNLTPF